VGSSIGQGQGKRPGWQEANTIHQFRDTFCLYGYPGVVGRYDTNQRTESHDKRTEQLNEVSLIKHSFIANITGIPCSNI
jgi:hypothetical protein